MKQDPGSTDDVPLPRDDLQLRFDGAAGAPTLLLAHGAGAPMDSDWMQQLVERLTAVGLRVGRFEFPYMRTRRTGGSRRGPDRPPVLLATWRDAVAAAGGGRAVAIGGKSMGGRIASMVADEVNARAVVCFGYPFHPPGSPERPRVEHLAALRTPMLVLQGSRDPFGTPVEVEAYGLSPAVHIHWLPDGDHDLRPRVRSGHTFADHLDTAARHAADFIAARA